MSSLSSGDSSTALHMRLFWMWSWWRRLVHPFSSFIWKCIGAHVLACLKSLMNTFSTSVKVTGDCMIMVPQLLSLLLFYPLVDCRSQGQSGTDVPTQEHLSKGYSGCSVRANALLGKDASKTNSSAANRVPYCLVYTVDLGMPNLYKQLWWRCCIVSSEAAVIIGMTSIHLYRVDFDYIGRGSFALQRANKIDMQSGPWVGLDFRHS